MKVKLSELAQAMLKSDASQSYVDIGQGRVVMLAADMGEEEALEHVFSIEEDWEHYVPIPNLRDEEERRAMERFAALQPNEEIRGRLQKILFAPRAAWNFRQQVKRLLLLAKWNAFLQAHFMEAAKDWCLENRIEYEDG